VDIQATSTTGMSIVGKMSTIMRVSDMVTATSTKNASIAEV